MTKQEQWRAYSKKYRTQKKKYYTKLEQELLFFKMFSLTLVIALGIVIIKSFF